MSSMLVLLSATKEADAALVLWPSNFDTSTPAVDRTDLHHLEMVSLITGPCGLT